MQKEIALSGLGIGITTDLLHVKVERRDTGNRLAISRLTRGDRKPRSPIVASISHRGKTLTPSRT